MLLNSGTISHAADPTPPAQDLNLNSPEAVEQLKQDVLATEDMKKLIAQAPPTNLFVTSITSNTQKILEALVDHICSLLTGTHIKKEKNPLTLPSEITTFFINSSYLELTETKITEIHNTNMFQQGSKLDELTQNFANKIDTWMQNIQTTFGIDLTQTAYHYYAHAGPTSINTRDSLAEKITATLKAYNDEHGKQTQTEPTLTLLQIMKLKMMDLIHKISAK